MGRTPCGKRLEKGVPEPRVIGHENVSTRFARYERTNGYNAVINARQFASTGRVGTMGPAAGSAFGLLHEIASYPAHGR